MATRKKKGRPTPKPIKTAFDVLFFLTGLAALIVPSIGDLSVSTMYEIGRWTTISIVAAKWAIVYFKLDYEVIDNKTQDGE